MPGLKSLMFFLTAGAWQNESKLLGDLCVLGVNSYQFK